VHRETNGMSGERERERERKRRVKDPPYESNDLKKV